MKGVKHKKSKGVEGLSGGLGSGRWEGREGRRDGGDVMGVMG